MNEFQIDITLYHFEHQSRIAYTNLGSDCRPVDGLRLLAELFVKE
jgi:hypothetical protein